MGGTLGQRKDRAASPPQTKGGDDPLVPAEYLAHLLEVAGRFHVRPERLLRDTGIGQRALDEAGAAVPRTTFLHVVERALSLTGEPGLGYYHGLSLKLSSHGALGLLAMTSGTLGDAVASAERFMQLRARDFRFVTRRAGSTFSLELQHDHPAETEVFLSEAMLMMLFTVARALVGQQLSAQVEMPFAEPVHFRRFAHLYPGRVTFCADALRIHFPTAQLNLAVVTADSVMSRRIERECQRELAALRERSSALLAVRRVLRSEQALYPSLEAMAERLELSTRTLKRKLSDQGTSYREVVDNLRRERALLWLRDPELPLERIAERLGYLDVASLHRSFRRWFGTTPGSVRAKARPGKTP
jgi:AraC-like DNA-binding protein